MPYRTYEKRTRNYDLAVNPDVVRTKFESRKSAMLDGQEEMQAIIVEKETAIRNILDDNGIVGVMRVPYLNFGRTLIRAMGHQSGLALRKLADAEKAKFVAIGLDSTILDKIADAVIGTTGY